MQHASSIDRAPVTPPNGSAAAIAQSYYACSNHEWVPQDNVCSLSASHTLIRKFRVLTWNIDFQTQAQKLRMAAALRYLHELLKVCQSRDKAQGSGAMPTVIMLQEMTKITIELMKETAWIQERFYMTDISVENWPSPEYGTLTLIDRRLTISKIYRVPFETQMQRDGLFIDLAIGPIDQHDDTTSGGNKIIRLCNVHLESLDFEPALRPGQVKIVGEHLHHQGISAGLMAGDTNAIQEFDKTLAAENDLQDVYLSLDPIDGGGVEDAEGGNTWGYQSKRDVRDKYPPRRMDKIFWCGGLRPLKLERIGVDVCVEKEKWKKMYGMGLLNFVTDHYGLSCEVEVV